jgi:hypothetical protein
MQIPQWTKPALMGAGAGAVALAIVGFNWGGWMTGGSATEMSAQRTSIALVEALTPYCVLKARTDPNSVSLLMELKAASTYERRVFVEKAGWATPLGAEEPMRELAQACYKVLTEEV